MAIKRMQNRAGLTPDSRTELSALSVTGLTLVGDRVLTPRPGTKRHYKPRARKCACGCGRVFTPPPQAPQKRYFDDACRKRASRRKAAKTRQPKAAPVLSLLTCAYCGNTFLGVEGKGAKYCKPAHRTAAAEARRVAAIEAAIVIVGGVGGLKPDDVIAFVEREGMKKVSRYLRGQGYIYSEADRRWLLPVGADVFTQVDIYDR